jgi:hypothetical protein
MHVTQTSETQSQTSRIESAAPRKKSRQKSVLALSVFALGLNAAAAAYTMYPSDFALPDIHRLVAELLPHERAPVPMQDLVAAALSDIQSTQQDIVVALQDNGLSLHRNAALILIEGGLQRNAALLQDNGTSLQQNTALLQQNATRLDILRSSLTDERSDVKVISSQLSTLIAKVDSMQATTSEITSSISKERARTLLSGVARKRLAHRKKPTRAISLGGAPLTTMPAAPLRSPAG